MLLYVLQGYFFNGKTYEFDFTVNTNYVGQEFFLCCFFGKNRGKVSAAAVK